MPVRSIGEADDKGDHLEDQNEVILIGRVGIIAVGVEQTGFRDAHFAVFCEESCEQNGIGNIYTTLFRSALYVQRGY